MANFVKIEGRGCGFSKLKRWSQGLPSRGGGRPLRLLRTLEPARQTTEHRGDPAQTRHAGATGRTARAALAALEAAPAAGMLLKKRVHASKAVHAAK